MKAYGFVSERSSGSIIVQIVNEEGALLSAFQMNNYTAALTHAHKFCPKGHDFEFISDPFTHKGIKLAKENYKDLWGVDWYGSCRESNQ